MILLSIVHCLKIESLLSSFIYWKNYLYSAKPIPDINFCLNDCGFGGGFDLVIFSSGLTLGLSFLECNLDFTKAFGVYKNQNRNYIYSYITN